LEHRVNDEKLNCNFCFFRIQKEQKRRVSKQCGLHEHLLLRTSCLNNETKTQVVFIEKIKDAEQTYSCLLLTRKSAHYKQRVFYFDISLFEHVKMGMVNEWSIGFKIVF
jgi:hypothetical protein